MSEFRTNARRLNYPSSILTAVKTVETALVTALKNNQRIVDHDAFCHWFETVIRPMRGKFITNMVREPLDVTELAKSINRDFAHNRGHHG